MEYNEIKPDRALTSKLFWTASWEVRGQNYKSPDKTRIKSLKVRITMKYLIRLDNGDRDRA